MAFLFSKSSRAKVIESAIDRRRRQQEEAEQQIRNEVLQKPILHLAKNRDYDEILFVLINETVNVRDWIDVAKTTHQSTLKGDTNASRRNSMSQSSAKNSKAYAVASRRLSASLGNLDASVTIDASESSFDLDLTNLRTRKQQQIQQESVLHQILKYDPPVEIIDLLILRMKEYNCFIDHSIDENDESGVMPEVIIDTKGRTALHVAVSIGASYDIVLRLVGRGTHHDLSSCPAFVIDSFNRYALHWACTNPSRVEVSKSCLNLGATAKSKTTDNYNLLKVIQLLVQINPDAVVEKDIHGETPIDIAKKYLVKDEILRLLEKVEKFVTDESKNKDSKVSRRKDRSRKTGKQSKHECSLGAFTSRTSTTTTTDTTLPSRESSSPQLKYNNSQAQVTRKLSSYREPKSTGNKPVLSSTPRKDKSTPTTITTDNTKNPSIPKEIFQKVEIVSDYYGEEFSKDYVDVEDDVSSVGSGGISTFAPPHQRQRVLTQI